MPRLRKLGLGDLSLALAVVLGVVGLGLIVVGQLNLPGTAVSTLPPIPEPTRPPTPTPVPSSGPSSGKASATPTATPLPANVVAVQLQVDTSPRVNVSLRKSTSATEDGFPPENTALIIHTSSEPGRGTNSYIVAHAELNLFKPLWNAQLGAKVLVKLSNGQVLTYRITEIHPNVSCPDPGAPPMPNPPLALQYADPGCPDGAFWTAPTKHERLTLQTSQGFNRNYGELVVVAEPVAP